MSVTDLDRHAVARIGRAIRAHRKDTNPPGINLSDRERLILSLLRDKGDLTRAALIRHTGLSGTAVFRATDELAASGLITLGEPLAEGRGQPSHVMSLNTSASYAVGLSVMTDVAEMLLIDLAGNQICGTTIPGSGLTLTDTIAELGRFLEAAQAQYQVDPIRIHAISIALAGFYVGEGDLLNPSSHLDDWALTDLRDPFEAAFGVPVTIENIANASAVGEQLLGLGRTFSSFAYINVAYGFGGGIIREGKLWRGVHGNAGEFAAVLEAAGETPPNLETLREALAAHGTETANVFDMIARFDMNWPGIEPWLTQSSTLFARLIYMIHATVDVEAVVLGGRLPRALAEALADQATGQLAMMFPSPRRGRGRPMPQIHAAEINASAAAIGAASIPLAKHFYDPIAHLNRASERA